MHPQRLQKPALPSTRPGIQLAPPPLRKIPPSLSPCRAPGWDPTAALHDVRWGGLLAPDAQDDLTSLYDMEALVAAARQELRRAGRGDNKMAECAPEGWGRQRSLLCAAKRVVE